MTDIMNQKREPLMELWKTLIPNFCPTEGQFNLWLAMYDCDDELLKWGIKETASKFYRRKGAMSGDYLVRFMSDILIKKNATKTQADTQAVKGAERADSKSQTPGEDPVKKIKKRKKDDTISIEVTTPTT
ncbi:MAG: hypothetical protein WB558_13605 [Terriglobales bacterium]